MASRSAQHEDHRLDALKKQRGEEVANAFIERRAADTAAIDLAISDIAKASELAKADGEAANLAVPVIQARIASLNELLQVANQDVEKAVGAEILTQHDVAEERYFEAIELMRAAAEEMVAAEKTWRHVLRPAPAAKFPGRGAKVLDDIRSDGLRVRWDHSQLRDSSVSNQYLPGFEKTYFVPWWADERNTAFAETQFSNNVREFQLAGYDCTSCPTPIIKAKEKTVVVEMVRGTVETSDSKIDPDTGKKVTVSPSNESPALVRGRNIK